LGQGPEGITAAELATKVVQAIEKGGCRGRPAFLKEAFPANGATDFSRRFFQREYRLGSMLNYIWLGLMLLAVVIAGCTDRLQAMVDQSFEMAQYAVMKTALPLAGIMALWLGVMRLAERSGLISLVARALRPLMRWLFPEVPLDHPAMGSMLLNMSANILGLGNAATPLGLKAMRDLESLNPRPGTATNAMCTFLAINTSSIQLIPATAIAILAANGSSNPTAIIGTSILATTCGAVAAVAAAKTLQRLSFFRITTPTMMPVPASEPVVAEIPKTGSRTADATTAPVGEVQALRDLNWWHKAVLCLFAVFFIYLFARLTFPTWFGLQEAPAVIGHTLFVRVVNSVSKLAIPFLLAGFPLYAALRRVRVYEEFVEGAKEGLEVALRIIPYLVAILVAIGMFRAAGGIDLLSHVLGPFLSAVGFPTDLLPLALMRPLSGSGALGLFTELVKHCGPDDVVSRMGGTIFGSTETTFYVLAVYFGSVAVRRTRHAILAGLTADLVAVVASVVVCRIVFR
jgi:spore maturation protein SpmA